MYASSCCADVDGDSIDEVFWSCGTHVQAYRNTGQHQFEQVWYWSNQDSTSANITAYDVNGNGYKELIVSGSGRTFIFEVDAIQVVSPNGGQVLVRGDTCQIRWRILTPPRCDSVSLFLRSDSNTVNGFYRLDTIAHGLSPNESTCSWVVPDTTLDSARVLAIAYGPGWQFDESDSTFRIAPSGVAGPRIAPPRDWALSVSPNPSADRTTVRWDVPRRGSVRVSLHDAAGRLVKELASGAEEPGRYAAEARISSSLPAGVYFCTLDAGEKRISRKVVLTE